MDVADTHCHIISPDQTRFPSVHVLCISSSRIGIWSNSVAWETTRFNSSGTRTETKAITWH
jgi:hypothetical protein